MGKITYPIVTLAYRTQVTLSFVVFLRGRSRGGIRHAVLAQKALYATFSVDDFLSAGVKRVVARPNINVQFGLSGANSHNFLAIAEDLSLWVPGRVNIRFSHSRAKSVKNSS